MGRARGPGRPAARGSPPQKTSRLCLFFPLVPAFPPCSRAPASSAPQVDALHVLDGAGAVAQAIGRKVPAFTRLAQEGLQEIPEGWQSTIKKRRGGQLRVRPNVALAADTHARARHCAVLPRAAPRRVQRVLVHDHGAVVRAEHNERNTGHVPTELGLARRKVRPLSAAPSSSRMAGVLFYHQSAYTMCPRGEFTPFVACTLVVASDTADNSFCRFARYTFFSRGWIDFLRNARYNCGASASNVT